MQSLRACRQLGFSFVGALRLAVRCEDGAEPVVTSPGPDKELGTEDDIASDGDDPGEREDEASV